MIDTFKMKTELQKALAKEQKKVQEMYQQMDSLKRKLSEERTSDERPAERYF